jgi:hypothetical protein
LAAIIVLLALAVFVAPSFRVKYCRLVMPLTYSLIAISIVATSIYVRNAVFELTYHDMRVRDWFVHGLLFGAGAWIYWPTVILTMLPQLLWISGLKGRLLPTFVIAVLSPVPIIYFQFVLPRSGPVPAPEPIWPQVLIAIYVMLALELIFLCALAFIEPPFRERFPRVASISGYGFAGIAFLGSASLFTGIWLNMTSTVFYRRWWFVHVKLLGPYAFDYWLFLICVLVPQLLWLRRIRGRSLPTFIVALISVIPVVIDRLLIHLIGWSPARLLVDFHYPPGW